MEKQHVNLIICTPGHSLMGSYVRCLLATIRVLDQEGITWAFSNEYSSHVADAREITLSGTYQNIIKESRPFHGSITYDKLMWIDSDINWTPEDILKLYRSKKDIVSGAYMLASGEVMAYKESFGKALKYEEVMEMTKPIKVCSTGFGFICIKSGIFELMSRPWFQQVNTTINLDGENYTFPIMGEDISWCHRAVQLGYDIWFDPTVKVTHNKMVKLTWQGIMP